MTPEEILALLGGEVGGGHTEFAIRKMDKNGLWHLYPAPDEITARRWIEGDLGLSGETLIKRRWIHGPWQEDVVP